MRQKPAATKRGRITGRHTRVTKWKMVLGGQPFVLQLRRSPKFISGDASAPAWAGAAAGLLTLFVAALYIQMASSRHLLEELVIERTAQLARANQALEFFNYSAAHDLRAPLRGIDGWSLALLEDYGELLDDEARKYLQRIRSDTQRMNQLIDDLLQLSKVSALVMAVVTVDVAALARQINARLQDAQPQRQVQCQIQAAMQAKADPRLLEIVLTNLLGNAWKFSSKNAHAVIHVGCVRQNNESVWYVKDNGVGFEMRYAQKLFTPFQRLHSEKDFPGTGIGLATVLRIVQRHGGRVWAEAEVGKGATFYFTLGSGQ